MTEAAKEAAQNEQRTEYSGRNAADFIRFNLDADK